MTAVGGLWGAHLLSGSLPCWAPLLCLNVWCLDDLWCSVAKAHSLSPDPLFAWLSAWLTTTEMGVLGGTSLQENAYPRLSKLGGWRVSELAPTSVWLVGVREGFKNGIHLALSLPERAPSDAHPSSTLSKASKSSNCCLYVGSQRDWQSIPVLLKQKLGSPHNAPSLPYFQPLTFKAQCYRDSSSWSRSPDPDVQGSWAFFSSPLYPSHLWVGVG